MYLSSTQILAEGENFLEDRARQLKPYTVQDEIQIANTVCLADWIESPQYSLWQQVAVVDSLAQALKLQTGLLQGQTLLSLDGYQVGPDWVIALDYDESSQAAQGALSHRIRLEEIELQLSALNTQLSQAEEQLPELNLRMKELKTQIQTISEQYSNCNNSMSILPKFKVVLRLSHYRSSNYSISCNNWMSRSWNKRYQIIKPCNSSWKH